jgi:cyclohexyl-isocyanide hydratase
MNRRDFAAIAGAIAGASFVANSLTPKNAVAHTMPPGTEPPAAMQHIVMVVYPKMTALDLIAPQLIFASLMNVDVKLVWKDKNPVVSDTGVPILPTATFDEIAFDPTVVFVPGGTTGTFAVMNDPATIDFLSRAGSKSRYVTSVCTGSLVLGAAGLLEGYRATTHWAMRDVLPLLGATPVAQRVVEDRNRITGAGVTAGLDFGLHMASKLRSDEYARMLQLAFEYDPQPPFDAGSVAGAGAKTASEVRAFYAPALAEAVAAAKTAQQRLGMAGQS